MNDFERASTDTHLKLFSDDKQQRVRIQPGQWSEWWLLASWISRLVGKQL
eukprot:COSAG02_NODE_2167_length_9609_cov_18.589485_2_plen_50_part_00